MLVEVGPNRCEIFLYQLKIHMPTKQSHIRDYQGSIGEVRLIDGQA